MKAFTNMKSPGLKDLSFPKPMVHISNPIIHLVSVNYAAWKPLLHQLPFTISTTEQHPLHATFISLSILHNDF